MSFLSRTALSSWQPMMKAMNRSSNQFQPKYWGVPNRSFSKNKSVFAEVESKEGEAWRIPSPETGMIGAEKIEKQGLIGRELPFNSLKGVPFGTKENPVNVLSEAESRVVGCRGGPKPEDEHELLWHDVRAVKPTVCLECGQVFKLKPVTPVSTPVSH